MYRYDPSILVRHMLEHAEEAVQMTQGRDRTDLDTDRQLNLALVRLMEVVGEAANRLPDYLIQRHSNIPWKQIVNLRNRLIHGYDKVDYDILLEYHQKRSPPTNQETQSNSLK